MCLNVNCSEANAKLASKRLSPSDTSLCLLAAGRSEEVVTKESTRNE